jgi:hypothetical protein
MANGNGMDVAEGTLYHNIQRQLNFVDTFSWAVGVHQLKFGIDYRASALLPGQVLVMLPKQAQVGSRRWCSETWSTSRWGIKILIPCTSITTRCLPRTPGG